MKAAIAERRKEIRASLANSHREHTKALKDNRRDDARRLGNEIDHLEGLVRFNSPQAHPVEFQNGFVVNGKPIEQLVKKLPKGFQLTASITGDAKLELMHSNGKITLYDLSGYYRGLKMPKGEVFLDGLGIDIVQPR